MCASGFTSVEVGIQSEEKSRPIARQFALGRDVGAILELLLYFWPHYYGVQDTSLCVLQERSEDFLAVKSTITSQASSLQRTKRLISSSLIWFFISVF
jgi:hypothetical protein